MTVEIKNEGDMLRKFLWSLAAQAIILGGAGLIAWGEMRKQNENLEGIYRQMDKRVSENRELIYLRTDGRFTRQDWESEERKIDARFERLQIDVNTKLDAIMGHLLNEK